MTKCKAITNKGKNCVLNAVGETEYCKMHGKLQSKYAVGNLQKEKLELEILELNKSWYKKAKYLRALFPGLATILAVLLTFLFSGYFDIESKRLENRKTLLNIEILDFKDQKDSLEFTYTIQKDSLSNVLQILRNKIDSLEDIGIAYENTRNELKQKEDDLKLAIKTNLSDKDLIKYYKNYNAELEKLKTNNRPVTDVLKYNSRIDVLDKKAENIGFFLFHVNDQVEGFVKWKDEKWRNSPRAVRILTNLSNGKKINLPGNYSDLGSEGDAFEITVTFDERTFKSNCKRVDIRGNLLNLVLVN